MSKIKMNKNRILIVATICLVLIVGIVILVRPNSNEKGGKEIPSELEVLEPDEVVPEDSTDVSEIWGDENDSDVQTDNQSSENKTDKQQSTTPNVDNQGNVKDEIKEDGILKDDITWGDIY